ncbi:hypothetical protein GCM10025865_29280 [Paraoerskovia sediminicola]|uniref:Secreted protein n=1 Tax=Paraoerskovia sediminicola TaxID=1138587 RepID=A0ABN6XFR5_9CELL|nr:hypothetical protein GCM10025865_29280 [Paraoerskovia sediminicola]
MRALLVCSSCSGAATQLARAEQLETLVEELFELLHRAALEEHVPVRARRLAGLRLGTLGVAEQGLLAAAALPDRGDLGLGGEREDDRVPVGAVVVRLEAGAKSTPSSVSIDLEPMLIPRNERSGM